MCKRTNTINISFLIPFLLANVVTKSTSGIPSQGFVRPALNENAKYPSAMIWLEINPREIKKNFDDVIKSLKSKEKQNSFENFPPYWSFAKFGPRKEGVKEELKVLEEKESDKKKSNFHFKISSRRGKLRRRFDAGSHSKYGE